MGIFDFRNVYVRADRLLGYHIGLLASTEKSFEKDGVSYYSFEDGKEDFCRIGYTKTSRLLSRTFNLEIKQILNNIVFDNDFKLKLRFKGFKEINGAFFVPERGSEGYEAIFNNDQLLDVLMQKAREVELAYVIIEYHKRQSQIEVRICPYGGAFLWVVIPPVFYDMKLSDKEIQTLIEIADLLKDFIDKGFFCYYKI